METFNPNQMPPISNIPKDKSIAPLIIVIVALIVVIVGGLYMINKKSDYNTPTPTQTDSIIDSLNQQSNSDDLNSIERDLNATNLDNLDQGASVIEAELQ